EHYLPLVGGAIAHSDITRVLDWNLPVMSLVAETPRGPGLDRSANIKSCSKSIVALLTGSAIASGAIAGLTATLSEVAPGIIPSDATAGAEDLTIEDLITLRAGLEGTSGGNYGRWVNSVNWVVFALRRPMIGTP